MGFSPGEFKSKSSEEFFFEGGGAGIELFGSDGKIIFVLDAKQALEAASQLMLLAEMLTEGRL